MITSSPSCCVQKKQRGEKMWSERLRDRWLSRLISMYGYQSWSSLMSPVKGLWWVEGGGGGSYLSGYHLPTYLAMRGCQVLLAADQREAGCSSSHRGLQCLQCTPGGCYQKGREATSFLIPQTDVCPHLWQPTFQISHCQVKYPLWTGLTGPDCMPDVYLKQFNISVWRGRYYQTWHLYTLNLDRILIPGPKLLSVIINPVATCLQMNDQTN